MDKCSIVNYENLTDLKKDKFKKSLAKKLFLLLSEIKNDDVLGALGVKEFVASSGGSDNADALVIEVYSRITSGIQVGSGNQNFFHSVLNAFVEAWNELDR